MALIKANDIVTSEENSLVTSVLEEDGLTLADDNVKRLLAVLQKQSVSIRNGIFLED
jgi:hypothetical protein